MNLLPSLILCLLWSFSSAKSASQRRTCQGLGNSPGYFHVWYWTKWSLCWFQKHELWTTPSFYPEHSQPVYSRNPSKFHPFMHSHGWTKGIGIWAWLSTLDQCGCLKARNDIAVEFNKQLKQAVMELRTQLPQAALTYVDLYGARYGLISHDKEQSDHHQNTPSVTFLNRICGSASEMLLGKSKWLQCLVRADGGYKWYLCIWWFLCKSLRIHKLG